ncbi:Rnf-Nqr domain containing protein [Pseudomonas chlororaphis]|uniref:Rnf-Nqr domain containing protein n=1 Tax=Pseudomonas chlororaphis TaxID=587753 RepID=UPI0007B3640A|nr:Rnf-Nqr domain containing protein [Pseudomonas chlororaphis]AZC52885.1 Electron transport complex protein RnfA [Pseudomonas chlororaphis subsp. piscium]AZC59142.1 Electron transport complex protein RnfA [Pseudomonas chlororaphis subsp. piscium]AZC65353.1 Electron transport complex protein RnfA [Pseudomonas chlororaphis subsp. piscium]AZC71593.1 Electron transport complex protein RnfA [Pseudomonas chlororaphis subsp. piscium]AZC77826.1 Electron transport complex protein RnfA [Pseudomonas chl
MTEIVLTLISAALINNFVLQWPLGVDPLLQASAEPQVARRRIHALGIATSCLMLLCSLLGYGFYQALLVPLGLTSLQLFVFLPLGVLLIAPLLKLLTRMLPGLPFDGLWPLLLGNAGVLGALLLAVQANRGIAYSLALGLGAGLGFWLVLSLFSDLRQRILNNDVPLPFRGLPIDLISAGLMAVAFLGFNGLLNP